MRINKIQVSPQSSTIQSSQAQVVPPVVPQQTTSVKPQGDTFKGKNSIFIPNTKEQPKYLYNKMLDVMKDCKIGGTIRNDGIDLPSVTQKALDRLKEFGIKFNSVDK